jgi:pilus assembly protein Flp/PilA
MDFLRDDQGVTAVEYGLIAGLLAVVLIGAWTSIGANLNAIFAFLATVVSPPAG